MRGLGQKYIDMLPRVLFAWRGDALWMCPEHVDRKLLPHFVSCSRRRHFSKPGALHVLRPPWRTFSHGNAARSPGKLCMGDKLNSGCKTHNEKNNDQQQ